MVLCITGTPGTGKTTVSEKLGRPVIHLTEFVKEHGLGDQADEFEVDIEAMIDTLQEEVAEDTVIEGHLSHYYPADICIVLRCRPDVLCERLEERDYSDEKIDENIEAEVLDVILMEALDKQDTVIEIDTTGKNVDEVVEEIKRKVEKGDSDYGNVDWSEFLDI